MSGGTDVSGGGGGGGSPDSLGNSIRDASRWQNVASNPNIVNPFGTVASSQGPNGQWNITTNPNGTLGALTNNAIDEIGKRGSLNLSQYADAVGSGDQANQRATQSAWDQSYRRLVPMYDAQETATRTRLANSGLDPTSKAYQTQMTQLGQNRNDAFQSALASAISQGTDAGHTVFGDNLAAQQNAANMYQTQWNQPMQTLGQLGGLMPGDHFNPDNASAAGAKNAADLQMGGNQYNRATSAATNSGYASAAMTAAMIAASFI